MKIYFAGLSGISNLGRLEKWLSAGMTKKLISYYELSTRSGLKELTRIKEINDDYIHGNMARR